jgi:hypothetical protein
VLRRALATVAFAIAIAAVVDPEIATRRPARPDIQLVAEDPQDAAVASDVERALSSRFTIARGPLAGASGTIVVGDRPPASSSGFATPLFAVVPSAAARISLERAVAPGQAAIDAQTPIEVAARITGARGRDAELELKSGDLTVDRIHRTIASDDERVQATLTYIPTSAGAVPLRIHASINGSPASASADVAVDAIEKRWPVLFYDPRPSWMSTFVRRALERDPRFVVTSRTLTSRTVSTDAGTPPGRLDDLATVSLYDAIVVGSPDALAASDVAALESFMRRRGGGVAFLLDTRAPGPYERLIGTSRWNVVSPAKPESIPTRDGITLRASELAWPAQLPAAARSLVMGPRPIVWQSPVGIGTVIVSGALDSWRYRDSATSGFERFWQRRIASLAENAVPAISLNAARTVVRPGDDVELIASMRDTMARPATDSVRYVNLGGGLFGASLRAPKKPGIYRLSAAVNADRAELPLIVTTDATPALPSAPDLVGSWAKAHGGESFNASNLGQLESSMRSAISAAPRLVLWHPMRAPWWIVPFALALSGEWWLRRRRGLR